ncbi:hypothetical protein [Flagellimonas sp.]
MKDKKKINLDKLDLPIEAYFGSLTPPATARLCLVVYTIARK